MIIESDYDVQQLKIIGSIVSRCIKLMGEAIRPGITTGELDDIGGQFLKQQKANSAPMMVYDFPGFTCVSVNEEAAHGIPGERIIQAGDLVNIDVSAEKNGYYADSGFTFQVGEVTAKEKLLCESTQKALLSSLSIARAGQKIQLIGKNIATVARKNGFTTLRDLGSHGVGSSLHEEPEFIANFYDKTDKRKLKLGQVMTIEPFLSYQCETTTTLDDGWTLVTKSGNRTAQYEHTFIVTKKSPIIVT